MSMATLERAILAGARVVLKNPKLRKQDIIEWSTGRCKPEASEVEVRVDDPGVWVCVLKEHDKRGTATKNTADSGATSRAPSTTATRK